MENSNRINLIGGELDGLKFDVKDDFAGDWPHAITFEMAHDAKEGQPLEKWRMVRYTFAIGFSFPTYLYAMYQHDLSYVVHGSQMTHWHRG